MAKATDTQIKNTKDALKHDPAHLPKGVRINFGDPEPIQKAEAADAASSPKGSDGKSNAT